MHENGFGPGALVRCGCFVLRHALAATMGFAGAASAQTAPPAASQVTPRTVAPERPAERPPEVGQPAEPAVEIPAGADDLRLTPQEFVLEDGFPERASADAALLAAGARREISVGDIYRLAGSIQAAYAAAGYPFVRVVVPPQDLADGRPVRLTLVDGFIEAIDFGGVDPALRRPAARYLTPLVGKRRLTMASLDRRISLLADLPGARVRTAIGAGERAGGVKLIVEAQLDPLAGSLSYDNRSSDAFRNRQLTFSGTVNGLLGLGDTVYVYASGDPLVSPPIASRAPRRVFGGGAAVPIGSHGIVVGLEYTHSRTEPVGGPFATRDDFRKATASVSHALIRSRRQSLSLRGSIERLRERQAAPEFGVLLFRDRYVIGRMRLDYVRYGDRLTIGGGAGLSYGGTDLKPERSKLTATSRFTKAELSAFASALLPRGGLVAGLTAQGQIIVDGGLPLAESFGLDGPNALSTFNSGAASADEGVVARATLSRPTPLADGRWLVSPVLFLAGGLADHAGGDPFLLREAASYGAGLQIASTRPVRGFSPAITLEYGWREADRAYARGKRLSVDLRVGF